jgi:hypothetical protein
LEFYDAVDEFRFLWPHDAASLVDDRRRAMADSARHIWDLFVAPVPLPRLSYVLSGAVPCLALGNELGSALTIVDGWIGCRVHQCR